MENNEMEKKELNLEELDQVSGGYEPLTKEELDKIRIEQLKLQQTIIEEDKDMKKRLRKIADLKKAQEREQQSPFF